MRNHMRNLWTLGGMSLPELLRRTARECWQDEVVALHSKPGNCPEWLFYCTQTPEFAVVTALKNRNKPIATKRDKVTFGI
jgi:hypothetical protein